MDNKDIVFELRKRIFEEWRYKRLTWREVKDKYGFSKKWFYKYRNRFLAHGYDGLKDIVRNNANRPHRISLEQKLKILEYVYDNPTHGPLRIANEQTPAISGKAVWSYLVTEDLNTRRKRRIWAHNQGKPVLTQKEIHCLSARYRHIESSSPGELIGIDTFWVNVSGLGRIYQYTACDTYSSYGWAWVYKARHSDNTIDFLKNRVVGTMPKGFIKRILTDQGTEFYSARHQAYLYDIEQLLKEHDIRHSVTKTAHPWTNGYAERLNQTIWEEFYLCRLTHPYGSIDELNNDLQAFMRMYNHSRRHTGYKLQKGGYSYPADAFYGERRRKDLILV